MVLTENQKIGFGLICLGAVFVALGVVMFFDTALIAIGIAYFLLSATHLISIGMFCGRKRPVFGGIGVLNWNSAGIGYFYEVLLNIYLSQLFTL